MAKGRRSYRADPYRKITNYENSLFASNYANAMF